jgi:mannose-6-phosphate isomerase-like protein (cupin superfamily)
MKHIIIVILFILPLVSKAQFHSLDTISAPASYENIYVKPIASDSLSSSFLIFVKKEVKKHKHATHSENVYILDGEGIMLLGDKKFPVKKGMVIFIPMNIIHELKVTSASPVKVLSIQSPMFDGKDRILID